MNACGADYLGREVHLERIVVFGAALKGKVVRLPQGHFHRTPKQRVTEQQGRNE